METCALAGRPSEVPKRWNQAGLKAARRTPEKVPARSIRRLTGIYRVSRLSPRSEPIYSGVGRAICSRKKSLSARSPGRMELEPLKSSLPVRSASQMLRRSGSRDTKMPSCSMAALSPVSFEKSSLTTVLSAISSRRSTVRMVPRMFSSARRVMIEARSRASASAIAWPCRAYHSHPPTKAVVAEKTKKIRKLRVRARNLTIPSASVPTCAIKHS